MTDQPKLLPGEFRATFRTGIGITKLETVVTDPDLFETMVNVATPHLAGFLQPRSYRQLARENARAHRYTPNPVQGLNFTPLSYGETRLLGATVTFSDQWPCNAMGEFITTVKHDPDKPGHIISHSQDLMWWVHVPGEGFYEVDYSAFESVKEMEK